jgi:site-specific DNA-methyltransferase (adenine-specific)
MDKIVLYKLVKNIYKSENIFNRSVTDFRLMIFNQKMKSLFTEYGDVNQRMKSIEEIFNQINMYLGVSEVEKKQNGEVFTPFELINEMLNTLPIGVWSNPNLKWFDPANGVGNFPAIIIQRLMVGLKEWEPNDKKRYKHILEKMIYVCDISSKNMFLYLNIFDPNNEYNMNYFKGSFLTKEFDDYMKNIWGVDRFDNIIGNPPYQSSDNKSNKLWVKFTKKVIKMTDNVCFVVPVSLMISESGQILDIRSNMVNKNNIFNLTKINIFNVGEKVVFFTSILGEKNTLIIFTDGSKVKIDSSKILSRLPIDKDDNLKISIIKKIETNREKNDYVYDFNPGSNQTTPERLKNKGLISYNQDDVFKYKVHHSASKVLYSKVLYSEYSKNNVTTYGNLKVVLNYSGGFVGEKYMFLSKDLIGKQMVGIITKSENQGNNIINIYSSKLFNWYILNEKSGGFNTGIFKLPKVDFDKKWTDDELFDYFNLTEEEIKFIEKNIPKYS